MLDQEQGASNPAKRGHQESLERLTTLIPQHKDAAAQAIEAGRIDPERFGMTKAQALDALEGGASRLESIGVAAPALEAIVKLTSRPPLLIRNNRVELEALPEFPADIDVRIKAVEPFIPSVGRVEFINHDTNSWGGTGWVFKRDAKSCVVATNRHVAELVARRTRDGKGVFIRSPSSRALYGAAVDFNEEADAIEEQARSARVLEIAYMAEETSADAALLKITLPAGAVWDLPDAIPLAEREAKKEELVALIGYPAYDYRGNGSSEAQAALARYFRDLYEVKRFAPGFLTQPASTGVISYDCTSLGGNSGSCVISLEQKAVVGLHFEGVYRVGNSAVSLTTLKALYEGKTFIISKELQSGESAEAADGVHQPADLRGRGGYDPAFLGEGLAAPWPQLPDTLEAELAKPSDATPENPHELRYTHFGVKFSTEKKLPVVTAVNIDGEHSRKIKRGDDKWFFDARIPLGSQHGARAYRDRNIDRGHMVRREDPNWGEDALQANFDTFHYVNSAPQHSELNQGKTLWQGLENYILNSARTEGFRACVFTGPVFGDEDPDIDGIQTPLEFWKLVVMVDADARRLHATAYLLSQGDLIRKLIEQRSRTEALEGFTLGEYRTFQIRIADLAEATGYDFGPLTAADPLVRKEQLTEAIKDKRPIVFELTEAADAVL